MRAKRHMSSEPDDGDDWWDSPAKVWSLPAACKHTRYIIERARRVPCSGDPGFIVEWQQYMLDFETKDERNAALLKLNEEHPMWRLRARDIPPHDRPYTILAGINPPVET